MSSVFGSEQNGLPQAPEPTRPKRPRSSLACIRCRKKKVKCDFVQPTCNRCGMASLPCSYATPPRRVDEQAFDQLGNHVEELKERMQRMQNELTMMKQNFSPYGRDGLSVSGSPSISSSVSAVICPTTTAQIERSPSGSFLDQQDHASWDLSLSQSGLPNDTNIASVHELYGILLDGFNDLNINNESAIDLLGVGSIKDAGESDSRGRKAWPAATSASAARDNDGSGQLWEVNDDEARDISREYCLGGEFLPKETLDHLIETHYHRCILVYEIIDKRAFLRQLANEPETNSLLLNSINAWLSKHVGIFHQEMFPNQNPYTLGEGYYRNAGRILKNNFDMSSTSTIYALLNLYMYQTACERSDVAYLYIGLAVRMAQHLELYKNDTSMNNPQEREQKKRLWWSIYCLDLRSALESNRSTMVNNKECDLDYPVRLEHEDDAAGYRICFCVNTIKLLRIRENAIKRLPLEPSEQDILTAISELEDCLTTWYSDLPPDLRLDYHDSFLSLNHPRDEVCLLLNIQLQTTWIMLHKSFLPKVDQPPTPLSLLALNICTKAANFITRMLDFYSSSQRYWCHFQWALEGIIVSISIHHLNALSNERENAILAQRNLIITANILRNSPMTYMTKVNQTVENIERFLEEKGIPTNLDDLPFVDEQAVAIDGEPLSSVYQLSQIQSSDSQQQQESAFVFDTDPISAVINSNQRDSSQSSLDVSVPLGSLPAQSAYSVRTQSQSPSHSFQATASPQSTAATTTTTQTPQLPDQGVATYGMSTDANNPASGMMGSSSMFGDSLMELEMSNNDSTAMNHLLIGFDVNSASQGGNNPVAVVSSAEYAQRMYGAGMEPALMPSNPQMHAQGFSTGNDDRAMAAAGYTGIYTQAPTQQRVPHRHQQQQQQQRQQQQPSVYPNYYSTPEMVNFSPMRSVRSQQHPPQQQQQQQQHPPPPSRQQQQQQQYPVTAHHHQGIVPNQGYDPLFGQMDPSSAAAINTLLPPGQQFDGRLNGGNSQYSADNGYPSYINGPRKRTRGNWSS